jgi:hypothetical protein
LVPINTFADYEGVAQESEMNPFIIDDSRERYQERLNEAEQWRRAKRARGNRVSRVDHLRTRIGEHLIALGEYLKATARQALQFD